MIPSPLTQAVIADYREKARLGTLTIDEMREAIVHLRGARTAAPPPSKRAAATPAPSVDDLFNELDNL